MPSFKSFSDPILKKVLFFAAVFEIDRIVLPAINMNADRVWLITHNQPYADKGDKFVKLI